jgi:hypothetical protein
MILEDRMKKVLFYTILVIFMVSCVTMQDHMLSPQERTSVEIIGRVSAEFITIQPLHIILKDTISKKAYSKLIAEARKQHQGDIDVVNITADGSFHVLTLLPIPWGFGFYANVQKITATGDVIKHNTDIDATGESHQRIGDALQKVSQNLIERLSNNSTIAVLSMSSPNRDTSEYIIDELEYHLVNSGKFAIVDRRRLDQIRGEQNFQMSGDVDDNSAVSIGNMLGANIVLTGSISIVGTTQTISVKALDVKTARILTMAREQL